MKPIAVRLLLLISLLCLTVPTRSQSVISGDLAGVVYDSSGAVVSNASLNQIGRASCRERV